MLRYRVVRFTMNLVRLVLLAKIAVNGRQNLPAQGPYLVVLNHTSTVDTPLLLLTFPIMKWRFFAVEKWKHHPVFGPLMAWLGAIYVARGEIDRRQLRRALQAIEDGFVFGLAPEGTRSKTGQMMLAKDGAAYLATRTHVPIVPVGLVNCDTIFDNFKRLKTTQLQVNIGEPFYLPEMGRRVRAKELPTYTHYIMVKIAQQLPERYRGVYADSPALATLERGENAWYDCIAEVTE